MPSPGRKKMKSKKLGGDTVVCTAAARGPPELNKTDLSIGPICTDAARTPGMLLRMALVP